jgi:maltose/moltooligosaccharide transporter
MRTTPEIPATPQEIEEINRKNEGQPHLIWQFFISVITSVIAYAMMIVLLLPALFYKSLFRKVLIAVKANSVTKIVFAQNIEIIEAILDMPRVMWQLALVYLFQWYALFCYWQNASKSIGLSVWQTTPAENPTLYEQAVSWGGLVNGWYNIVTFLTAFALVWFVKKSSAKAVHFTCLVLAAIGLLMFPFIENKYLLFPAITGFGIGWASMMGIPYLLVVGNIPKERYGVYMGIINMMIVVPMILQTVTFGYVLKNLLGNNSSNAVLFAGVLLVLAALATLFIKAEKGETEISLSQPSGH